MSTEAGEVHFNYTPVDAVESYAPPDLGIGSVSTGYQYNDDHQLKQVDRPDGKHIVLGYDSAGRAETTTILRGVITNTYSPSTGYLDTITAPGVTLSYGYEGPIIKSETWSGDVSGSVSRTFDADLRIDSQTVNGSTIALGYDDDGLLTSSGSLSLARKPGTGQLDGTTLGNMTDSYDYYPDGSVKHYTAEVGGTVLLDVDYHRDELGRIDVKTETAEGETHVYGYTYWPAGQLHEVKRDGIIEATYSYDPNGNRVTKTTAGGTIAAVVDDQDRLSEYGEFSYTYTSNGELRTKSNTSTGDVTTYTYDELGALTRVVLPDGQQVDYAIDGRNRRIAKKVNGDVVEKYVWDGQLRIVGEYVNGSLSRFVYASHVNVPDYMVRDGVIYRLVTDHVGSVRLVVNASTGVVAQRLDYDAFGIVKSDSNAGFQPFGFAGGLYDPQTMLVRFGARDYDATSGRWTAKDPLRFGGGDSALYGYVSGDPMNAIDPTGLATVLVIYTTKFDNIQVTDANRGVFQELLQTLAQDASLTANPAGNTYLFAPVSDPSTLEAALKMYGGMNIDELQVWAHGAIVDGDGLISFGGERNGILHAQQFIQDYILKRLHGLKSAIIGTCFSRDENRYRRAGVADQFGAAAGIPVGGYETKVHPCYRNGRMAICDGVLKF